MKHQPTILPSMTNFEKGSVQIIDADPKHYVFSNVFDVASKSKPYERVAVALNVKYTLEAVRAEGTSPWYSASHDEAVLSCSPLGKVRAVVVKPETKYQGVLQKRGDSFLWLSGDERRFPLRLEAKVKIGAISPMPTNGGLVQPAAEIGRALPRTVKVVEVQNGKVPTSVLLGLGAAAESDLASRPSHHDGEEEHDHEDFETFIVDLPVFDSPQQLVDRIVRIAEQHDVLRAKGFADIKGKPMRLLVQGVGSRIQHHFDRPWKVGEARRGRLVVIGQKGLDQAAIRALILG